MGAMDELWIKMQYAAEPEQGDMPEQNMALASIEGAVPWHVEELWNGWEVVDGARSIACFHGKTERAKQNALRLAQFPVLVAVLGEIAGENKQYLGHGNFEIHDNCSDKRARDLARACLAFVPDQPDA
jgi:hypothetical protein